MVSKSYNSIMVPFPYKSFFFKVEFDLYVLILYTGSLMGG